MATIMEITVGDKKYVFDPDRVRNDEAMAIEKACGCTFTQWINQVTEGSVTAFTALVWILQRRENPKTKFSDVCFEMGDFDVDIEADVEEDDAASVDAENPTRDEEASTREETDT